MAGRFIGDYSPLRWEDRLAPGRLLALNEPPDNSPERRSARTFATRGLGYKRPTEGEATNQV
jgi:hypothetical protein